MNKNIIWVIVLVIVAGGAFYLGTKANTQPAPVANATRGGGFNRGGAGGPNGGFVAGDIMAKDDKSVTIKLRDGGSKIVFLSATTPILKSVAGSVSDLQVGTTVTVTGAANSDGSVTAQSVQVRPVLLSNN